VNQLCREEVASVLFEAVRFYQKKHKWFVHLMLLMPDRVHFLVRFAMDVRLRTVIADWKRFTSTHAEIDWQRDFFDHRLRGDEGWRQKADYILANPVRAGLAIAAEDWPYVLINER
jgi:putative transposase